MYKRPLTISQITNVKGWLQKRSIQKIVNAIDDKLKAIMLDGKKFRTLLPRS